MKTTIIVLFVLVVFSTGAFAAEDTLNVDLTIYKNKYTLDPERVIVNAASFVPGKASKEAYSPDAPTTYTFLLLDKQGRTLSQHYYTFSFMNEHTLATVNRIEASVYLPYQQNTAAVEIHNQGTKLATYALPFFSRLSSPSLKQTFIIIGLVIITIAVLITVMVAFARRH